MCGIAGIFYRQMDLSLPKVVKKMCKAIYHRGPDDNGIYVYENFAVGMQRLSIIDLETGDQPFLSDNGRYIIVYNGELYNYMDIRKELISLGITFKTNSDTEVVLQSYLKWGIKSLDRFNGMFAFCIFDKNKKELFLARDRLGVKPLYYTTMSGKGFAFASEIKALLEIPGIEKDINHIAVNQYLIFEYIPEPLSIYKQINKLPSASYLTFGQNRDIKINSYWELNPHLPEEKNFNRAKEKIRYLMNSSVKYRLVSDVPFGLFLSGGIDSSIIAFEMSEILDSKKVNSFSIGFKERSYNESSYAKMVADHVNINNLVELLDEDAVLKIIYNIVDLMDEPLADASIIPTYLLSKFTRKHVKVALSGDGGDELFLGYDIHRAHKIAQIFKHIPLGLNKIILKSLDCFPVSDVNVSFEFKVKKFLSATNFPSDIANILWWGAYKPETLSSLLLSKSVSFEEIFNPVIRFREKLKGLDLLKQIGFIDIHLYLKDNLLPKVDRASMANSLEVRNPFLDYRLVEYAMRIPSSWKLRGNNGKYILKSIYKDQLPSQILKRPKKGFDIPLTPWLRYHLKPLIDNYLSKKKIEDTGLFHYSFVKGLIDGHLSRKKNYRQLLWPLLVYQMWHEKYGS